MNEKTGIANAENRVKEMERLTRQYVEQSNRYMNKSGATNQAQPRFENMRQQSPVQQRIIPAAPPKSTPPAPKKEQPPPPPASDSTDSLKGLQNILRDKDRLLLLALMVLLLREKADIKLILALGYILL